MIIQTIEEQKEMFSNFIVVLNDSIEAKKCFESISR